MHVRGGCDHEIERSSPWLPAAAHDGRCESSPLARNRGVDGKGIEGCLHDSQPLCTTGSLVLLRGDENAEVQLSERRGADRSLEVGGPFRADQDGRVQEGAHLLDEDVDDLTGKARQVGIERLGDGRVPNALQRGSPHPLTWTHRPKARNRAAGDRDGELFAGLSPPEHFADVVAQLLLRNGRHAR